MDRASPSISEIDAAPALTPTNSRLLSGPVGSSVLWLALPVLGEQVLNACVTWNDALLAGRISPMATGAIGMAGYVGWFVTMMFALAGIGGTAVVARAMGAGNAREARHATNQAVILGLCIGAVGTIFATLMAPALASLLNMQGDAWRIAVDFIRIDSRGYVGAAVTFALAACLRGAGDARTPLKILGLVNIANCILSWVLTFGIGSWPGIGVNGIAWGTATARWIGGIAFFIIMLRGRQGLKLVRAEMRPDPPLLKRMLRVGLPAGGDGAVTFAGHFIFMILVTHIPTIYPTSVLYAAHIVGIRIESLSFLPANAWAMAAATIVGQNLGARQPERARRAAHAAVRQCVIMLCCTGAIFFAAAWPFFKLLSNDPRVWECGVPALRGLAFCQPALAVLIVYLGALRGAGDTRVPMLITLLGMGCLRLPFAYLGGYVLAGGLLGAWLGMYADLIVRAILMAWRFRSGAWQRIRV